MRTLLVSVAAATIAFSGVAVAGPERPIVYEDPDDTDGPLDVLRLTRTLVTHEGERHYAHRVHFQERWEDDEVHLVFSATTHDFRVPSWCEEDDCTGDWEGHVFEDEDGTLRGNILEVSNCNDCQPWSLDVSAAPDGDVVFFLPRDLFYRGTDRYLMQLETQFDNTFRTNAEPACRVLVCHDEVPGDDEWLPFPVGGRARG